MFKDAISLIVAIISIGYILFANPALAASPPAVPTDVSSEHLPGDTLCPAGNTTDTRGDPTVVCINADKQCWRLLAADEIHRLLTIHKPK